MHLSDFRLKGVTSGLQDLSVWIRMSSSAQQQNQEQEQRTQYFQETTAQRTSEYRQMEGVALVRQWKPFETTATFS